ncbi:MAG: phage tail protein [Erythrobacter sp.]|uniref:GTA baseplate fiber-binding domain-containing protein n=1 Tax=Erythrobacter sp. TaxID=1042 RepID=UPI002612A1FF|nr:phage tail protein [Erythrobacter sp.]MDJ0979505.1 phage tail protein [Erythrobacter sp.]
MATLLLTAVGTAIGGPLGGAIGAFVGQQADRAIFGAGSREGPRLKELSVTTSTYGQPIARNFGRMRVAGSVIWATDLAESTSTQGGGKGQPKTTTYSYSASFAVALSSTPIRRVGRIWADGNLLRGTNGDLKTEGQFRAYLGNGDASVDPLISADKGAATPAFRDCAYVVFEDLQLADFGNRIPALTFEIFTERDTEVFLKQLVPGAADTSQATPLEHTRGFSDEGGPLSGILTAIDRVFPLSCSTTREGLRLFTDINLQGSIPTLPEQVSDKSSEDADQRHRNRAESVGREPLALRYYDEERDYQPGVQRAIGMRPNGRELMVDLPATMTASGAKAVASENANRARWLHENVTWRVGVLDPEIQPGTVVRLPESPGIWRVTTWEWHDRGIELGLERLAPQATSGLGGDTGVPTPPPDLALSPTQMQVFEAPLDDISNPSSRVILAAVSSASAAWKGAALYAEQGASLLPLGSTGSVRSIFGFLSQPLEGSAALVFEPNATIELQLVADDLGLSDTDFAGLASGKNRLLIGAEVVQFQTAQALGGGAWRLQGLLRGRAGTEEHAQRVHSAQTPAILLDAHLTDLSQSALQGTGSQRVAAIGSGDAEAVYASVDNVGLSRRPPTPVHPRTTLHPDGSLEMCWTRRARGQWRWDHESEVPLVEESERYVVGYGAVGSPYSIFSVSAPQLTLQETEISQLLSAIGAADFWVRQIGTYSQSNALFLTRLN